MRCWTFVVAFTAFAAMPLFATARGHGGHSSSGSRGGHSGGPAHHSTRSHSSGTHASTGTRRSGSHAPKANSAHAPTTPKAFGVRRDSHEDIKRDPEQRAKFMRTHPCPSTGKTSGACPGYLVDHVQALKHGGRDDPSNMQWQSAQQAKAKDKWE